MSHISTYKEMITNKDFFLKHCRNHGEVFLFEEETPVKQYGNNFVKAIAKIRLPGWQFDIALTASGELKYDHWGSKPGSMEVFHSVLQDYKTEMVTRSIPIEAESWTIKVDEKTEDNVIEIYY